MDDTQNATISQSFFSHQDQKWMKLTVLGPNIIVVLNVPFWLSTPFPFKKC